MTEETKEAKEAEPNKPEESSGLSKPGPIAGFLRDFFKIRDEPSMFGKSFMAVLFLGLVLVAWYLATRGEPEQRLIAPQVLGSPREVFGSFGTLWFDRALMRNLLISLGRVFEGFALAGLVGIPLGILSGTFKRVDAFFAPLSVFGRNIPITTLVPITLLWFGTGETQKIFFIFIACVAFVMFDTARSIADVDSAYLDTAYTLGASRRQVLTKVLIPLSLPGIFNSMRLLFGLAFGYIILSEMIDMNSGIGMLILVSQRRGPREHVYLILFFITLVAYLLDRLLFATQQMLFAYRYGRS